MLTLDQVKAKSSARIGKLHKTVARASEMLIEDCYKIGIQILITQGVRTYAEQTALYAQGRNGDKRQVVTNAKAGESYHNFGVAIDFALLLNDGREVSWDTLKDTNKDSLPDWSQVIDIGKKLGFFSGADFRSFKDLPHFEMTFGLNTAQYRMNVQPSAAEIKKITDKLDSRKVVKRMKPTDANIIINTYLKPAYAVAKTPGDKKEVGRLADELRIASGQVTQNS